MERFPKKSKSFVSYFQPPEIIQLLTVSLVINYSLNLNRKTCATFNVANNSRQHSLNGKLNAIVGGYFM